MLKRTTNSTHLTAAACIALLWALLLVPAQVFAQETKGAVEDFKTGPGTVSEKVENAELPPLNQQTAAQRDALKRLQDYHTGEGDVSEAGPEGTRATVRVTSTARLELLKSLQDAETGPNTAEVPEVSPLSIPLQTDAFEIDVDALDAAMARGDQEAIMKLLAPQQNGNLPQVNTQGEPDPFQRALDEAMARSDQEAIMKLLAPQQNGNLPQVNTQGEPDPFQQALDEAMLRGDQETVMKLLQEQETRRSAARRQKNP